MSLPSEAQIRNVSLLDTVQLARLLHISKNSLYMRLQRGLIPQPHYRLGGPKGCLIWVATKEMVALLGIDPADI